MTPLTALDLAGIPTHTVSNWVYRHACPWCGSDAWSGRYHTQCISPHCAAQVMSPLDVLATHMGGDYAAASAMESKALRCELKPHLPRVSERRVMEFWLRCCQSTSTVESGRMESRLAKAGLCASSSSYSSVVLSHDQIRELVLLAEETGAAFPQGWSAWPPAPCMAYCVQSMPFTIDRIVLVRKGDSEVVWNRHCAGISGMIGLTPSNPRYLASDALTALNMQQSLAAFGRFEEVASVFADPWKSPVSNPWRPDVHLFTAVPGSVADLVRIQAVMDSFPSMAKQLRASTMAAVKQSAASDVTVSWAGLRVGHIIRSMGSREVAVSPAAAQLFEQTGSRIDDAAVIISRMRHAGRLALADDFSRLTDNRLIFKDSKVEVRESSDDCYMDTFSGRTQIANFNIRLEGNVRFRDRSDTYCMGKLRCGTLVRNVVFRHSLLSGKAARLQEELHNHLVTPGATTNMSQIPTVVDASAYQRYVIPSLHRQLSMLPLTEGISRVGWSSDRKTFHAPGMTLDADGRTKVPAIFYPGVLTLKSFVDVPDWADVCPSNLHPVCQDIISILTAITVRYYKRCLSRPVCVMQSSDSVAVLEGMTRALGQTEVFDMGVNVRDVSNVDGVNGYPFLASGYGQNQLRKANLPYVILTDEGYRIDSSPDSQQIEAGGRALQFALIRVAEWCLATGADDFREVASVEHHTSLLKEGQWLAVNVCDLQPWETSVGSMQAFEFLLSQIPASETKSRMTLVDGDKLHINLSGVVLDRALLASELSSLGVELESSGDVISAPAASILPPMAVFYGQSPDVELAW